MPRRRNPNAPDPVDERLAEKLAASIAQARLAEKIQARGRPPVPGQHVAGPDLWTVLYFSLWLTAALLAALVAFGRPIDPLLGLAPRDLQPLTSGRMIELAGWTLGLGLTAWLAARNRIEMHDLLVGLSVKERLVPLVFTLVFFLTPMFPESTQVLRHGFLWATPFLLLLAATPSMTRRLLAWMLAGAWFCAGGVGGAAGAALVLGFAAAWLLALGATHFAYLGDPHGLGGWWPARRLARNTVLTALPALLAAVVVWWAWPQRMRRGGGATDAAGPGAPPGARPTPAMDGFDAAEFVYRGVLGILAIIALVILMVLLRRFFRRRLRVRMEGDFLPGQIGQLEQRPLEDAPARPRLSGLRGRIVGQWARWARAMGREVEGRRAGESAAEFAARLARENSAAAPPAELTALLERAHYGETEPAPADAETMRRLVQEELSRQSLRRQQPVDEGE
ncbi:MAG TPA: DUF4129 domain-containing protein [Candidatus Sumerlaeota bacterium]|nr:DUF4129 domain-containing protein [Candidatus Sumerlaeota bacterium]HOR29259.1 DUF4129 domain-containing protein [Candidatus Sumerlaeota bacterium]